MSEALCGEGHGLVARVTEEDGQSREGEDGEDQEAAALQPRRYSRDHRVGLDWTNGGEGE